MPNYYVNMEANSNGVHEMHTHDCRYLPISNKKVYLGYFFECKDAIKKAKEFYKKVNACSHCSSKCYRP